MHSLATDALMDLLVPFWQLVIAGCVVVAVVVSARRLSARGGSRMVRGMVVTAAMIVGLALFGLLVSAWWPA